MNIPAKLVSFIIQAVLVVLAVFLFSFVDPFGIFNSKKLRMKETPVAVNSIKAIGKLITAEYYGEVIKSSSEMVAVEHQTIIEREKNALIDFEGKLMDALDKIKAADPKKEINNRRKLFRRFEKNYKDSLMSDTLYGDYIDAFNFNTVKKYNEKEVLYERFQKEEYLAGDKIDSYLADLHKKDFKTNEKKFAKESIALLGRGSVKAGIDFSQFDDTHFEYDPDHNTVILKNIRPEIISATINPWFIPQKKIPGFEFLYVGKKIDRNSDSEKSIAYVDAMKKNCLDQLINDARTAGLLEKAKENATHNLAHFLSLLLEKEVKVIILGNPLEVALYSVLKKQTLTPAALQYVDSLAGQFADSDPNITFQFLKTVNDSLVKNRFDRKPWPGAGSNWEILSHYQQVAADSFLTDAEIKMELAYAEQKRSSFGVKDLLYLAIKKPGLLDRWLVKTDSLHLADTIRSLNQLQVGYLETEMMRLKKRTVPQDTTKHRKTPDKNLPKKGKDSVGVTPIAISQITKERQYFIEEIKTGASRKSDEGRPTKNYDYEFFIL